MTNDFYVNPFLKFARIPETELMHEKNQVSAYAKANFSESHAFIVQQLKDRLPEKFSPEKILDLGAGPGDMTSRLHRLFPKAQLTALDGSSQMLDESQIFFQSQFPEARIQFQQSLLQEFIPEDSFDLIFSNSLLHHVHDPFDFWSLVQRASDENTLIFICDLIRPSDFQIARAQVDLYAKEESDFLREDFYNSLLAAYNIEEVEKMLHATRLDHKLKLEEISDRHWVCYSKGIS
jgi:ubiquinone/menaquinone biosynthesis C-methylase UbiE